jgi:hypothetical protein
MSERQQLALIKRLELAATASTLTPNNGEILQLNFIYARNCQRPFPSTAESALGRRPFDEAKGRKRPLKLSYNHIESFSSFRLKKYVTIPPIYRINNYKAIYADC